MSTKKQRSMETPSHPGQGKRERYIQPSILLGLLMKASYGYELIRGIQQFGFVKGQAPPGMIYRHLRQLEKDGLVSSEWETAGAGPAKRVYGITEEGRAVLAVWADYMAGQAKHLNEFIDLYNETVKSVREG